MDKISPKAVGIDTSTHYYKEIPGWHSQFLELIKTPTDNVINRKILCLLILLFYLHSNNLTCLYNHAEQSVNKVATTICNYEWIKLNRMGTKKGANKLC